MDTTAIAAHLRSLDTETAGAAYLRSLGADRDHDALVAIATALGLSRIDRLSKPQLVQRILKQAIGARRKFQGLRHW